MRPALGWAWVVVVAFAVSGAVHLVSPATFDAQVPDPLPARDLVVRVSGVAELLVATAAAWPRTRRTGATAAAVLLVLVLPGNLWQAGEAVVDHRSGEASTAYLVATLVRLPLQVPLVWWTWRAGRGRPVRWPLRPRPLRSPAGTARGRRAAR